jgi:hypothetical protein
MFIHKSNSSNVSLNKNTMDFIFLNFHLKSIAIRPKLRSAWQEAPRKSIGLHNGKITLRGLPFFVAGSGRTPQWNCCQLLRFLKTHC